MNTRAVIDEAMRSALADLAAQKESVLREAARERLPRFLRWAVDRPRVLKWFYKIHHRWCPTIVYGADLGLTVAMVERKDKTLIVVNETFAIRSKGE